jgi:alcohol dehydrogenase
MTMRAAVLEQYDEPLAIETVEMPDSEPDGIVVAVEACGICRSDWHAWQSHGEWANDQAPIGQVLGHEPAGEVRDRLDPSALVSREVSLEAISDRLAAMGDHDVVGIEVVTEF